MADHEKCHGYEWGDKVEARIRGEWHPALYLDSTIYSEYPEHRVHTQLRGVLWVLPSDIRQMPK